MKALKIALPILLVIVLAGAAYLYFFSGLGLSYDHYVQLGDNAAAEGRYDRAVTMYSRALEQRDNESQLIIKLADAYSETGNYTKAEYTLVGGINRLPENIPLYTALSRTYVAQDKLLDAAILLDGVTNEYARTQLSELRPAAPVISPESGEYDEFITVNVSYPASATAYVSTDGDYPSLDSPALTTEVVTSYGETTVYAVAVAEDGLISDLAVAQYTVANVIEDVSFTDPVLENEVRTALGVDSYEQLTTEDLWEITTLFVPADVQSLEDMRWFGNLPAIIIESTAGLDLSRLSMCYGLRSLTVANAGLSSAQLDHIAALTGLTYLDVSGNGLASLAPLSGLTGLNTLLAENNSIFDLSPLSGLQGMLTLDLSDNSIEDISPLWAMTAINSLDLSNNPLSDIDRLSGMAELQTLDISSCTVTNAGALAGKARLRSLNCSDNDIASLASLADATALETLYGDNNAITDVSFLANLTALRDLSLSGNLIAAVPSLSGHSALYNINLSSNQLTDLSPFANMAGLNFLNIDYNNVSDLSPLTSCRLLALVDAFANPIEDAHVLTDLSIVVNIGLLDEQQPAEEGE